MALIKLLYYICFYLLIILFSLLGDFILKLPRPNTLFMYLVAITDTLIHGIHAFFTWLMLTMLKIRTNNNPLYFCDTTLIVHDILITMIISISIDFDHIIVAKSFSIQEIHKLTGRPFLHNTTALITMAILFIYLPVNKDDDIDQHTISYFNRFGWLLFNATIAHHIRDGLRHGLNLYPFPSTNSIPLVTYYVILFLFPIIIHWYSQCKNVDFGYSYRSSSRIMEEISV
ncbi:transmembrane protein 267 [Dermatophagoides farinae]|uniref:transmembrane protein 267 n=1 Tax=Dermatophagoides farinae TaxID=6954 RepID=UPI003F5F528B